ncbi:hypothetical protein [Pseudoalteromonas sp. OOF1S-7]|uniref:hypothetical protein n=1 Tax=Pseudoalteromonas sp. OOF1S-7 TaxID=2917757 RepID=UPI001EF5698D|nr:hypothetical protein [Pseudoalteromonas sp. OOF1S-7]MCG7536680.1 hypothetical protein [Pseudoalteromonas sp. OOF1S-7]
MNEITWLVCAVINAAIAILHLYIIYVGAPAYRYFGAGEAMATKAENGSWIPAIVTLGVTAVFFIFSYYNLAAAKYFTAPFLLYGLMAIAAIYVLRGSVVLAIPFMKEPVSDFDKVSSFIALGIGLLHCFGVYLYENQQGVY